MRFVKVPGSGTRACAVFHEPHDFEQTRSRLRIREKGSSAFTAYARCERDCRSHPEKSSRRRPEWFCKLKTSIRRCSGEPSRGRDGRKLPSAVCAPAAEPFIEQLAAPTATPGAAALPPPPAPWPAGLATWLRQCRVARKPTSSTKPS